MSKTKFIEPLPRSRLLSALLLLVLGLPIFLLGVQSAWEIADPWVLILRGFGTTLLTVSFLELLPEVARALMERKDRRLFNETWITRRILPRTTWRSS